MLGHIIGDFYLQTDKLAAKKKKSTPSMLLHCLLYTIVLGVGVSILSGGVVETLAISMMIFVSHLIIDLFKRELEKKPTNKEYVVFLVDQGMHMLVLFFIYFIGKQWSFIQVNHKLMIHDLDMLTCAAVALAVLVCWKPAGILVSSVFKGIPATIEQANQTAEESDKIEIEGAKIGYWIGVLEREIILMLGLMGQFGAIGFVLTAKSLARFKQLENKSFAEKYLVGTLLSAGIAIVCIVVFKGSGIFLAF